MLIMKFRRSKDPPCMHDGQPPRAPCMHRRRAAATQRLPYFWGVSRPAALNLRAFRAWPVPGQPHARARAPCMPAAWPADFPTRIRPAAFEPRREIYKMNPFCPGGRQNEPIRPQGTHFVSPASYLRSTFPKRTQCAWVLGLHVIS